MRRSFTGGYIDEVRSLVSNMSEVGGKARLVLADSIKVIRVGMALTGERDRAIAYINSVKHPFTSISCLLGIAELIDESN